MQLAGLCFLEPVWWIDKCACVMCTCKIGCYVAKAIFDELQPQLNVKAFYPQKIAFAALR